MPGPSKQDVRRQLFKGISSRRSLTSQTPDNASNPSQLPLFNPSAPRPDAVDSAVAVTPTAPSLSLFASPVPPHEADETIRNERSFEFLQPTNPRSGLHSSGFRSSSNPMATPGTPQVTGGGGAGDTPMGLNTTMNSMSSAASTNTFGRGRFQYPRRTVAQTAASCTTPARTPLEPFPKRILLEETPDRLFEPPTSLKADRDSVFGTHPLRRSKLMAFEQAEKNATALFRTCYPADSEDESGDDCSSMSLSIIIGEEQTPPPLAMEPKSPRRPKKFSLLAPRGVGLNRPVDDDPVETIINQHWVKLKEAFPLMVPKGPEALTDDEVIRFSELHDEYQAELRQLAEANATARAAFQTEYKTLKLCGVNPLYEEKMDEIRDLLVELMRKRIRVYDEEHNTAWGEPEESF